MSKTTIYIPVTICDGCELPPDDKDYNECSIIVNTDLGFCYFQYNKWHIANQPFKKPVTPTAWYKAVEVDSDGLDALVKKSLEEEKIKHMAADECKRGNRMWE